MGRMAQARGHAGRQRSAYTHGDAVTHTYKPPPPSHLLLWRLQLSSICSAFDRVGWVGVLLLSERPELGWAELLGLVAGRGRSRPCTLSHSSCRPSRCLQRLLGCKAGGEHGDIRGAYGGGWGVRGRWGGG